MEISCSVLAVLTDFMIALEIVLEFDFDSFGQIVRLTGEAGQATGKIATGLDKVKSLFKSSETGADSEVKLALGELSEQVANAKVTNAELKLLVLALQAELAQLQSFRSDLDSYELWETPTGALVYRLCQNAEGKEPLHFLCPTCVEGKRKSILQGHSGFRECPVCKSGFRFEQDEFGTVPVSRRSRTDGIL
ncbi:hypothetical protein [Pseudophaeobacter flagellatus]|uniref:hypothetical protein n=1 Tax=Pseudophaeobacter flagellatus TaxID=2899119 RepID=UPI001E2B171F|nr:hypothetical protein [Pseudophaeobacter flagellatus]MCD9146633.1 hypothetical protein [Pseudophaeobacter flagellatus]